MFSHNSGFYLGKAFISETKASNKHYAVDSTGT